MLIKIDKTLCRVVGDSKKLKVDVNGEIYTASNLADLIQTLELTFDEVALHSDCVTEDIHKLDRFLRLGFKFLNHNRVMFHGEKAKLYPSAYMSSRERGNETERQRGFLRLYNVITSNSNVYILTEPEVEALISTDSRTD